MNKQKRREGGGGEREREGERDVEEEMWEGGYDQLKSSRRA